MDEYLAAISTLNRPAPPPNPHPHPTNPAGGITLSLWTLDRIERLGIAVRSLSARGFMATSKATAADLICNEMKGDDPRITSAEVLQFLNIYYSTRRLLLEGTSFWIQGMRSRRITLRAQRPDASGRRFSPYSGGGGGAARRKDFAWGMKTHRMFLDAVERLGGLERAEAEAILRLMKESDDDLQETGNSGGGRLDDRRSRNGGLILNGLTSWDVGVHLMKFRQMMLPGKGPAAAGLSSSSRGGGDAAMLDSFGDLKLS